MNGSARIVENDDFAQLIGEVQADANSPKPERWLVVSVSDAFIHCSKHVPQMRKVDQEVQWGTDDPRLRGGDYFGVAGGQK